MSCTGMMCVCVGGGGGGEGGGSHSNMKANGHLCVCVCVLCVLVSKSGSLGQDERSSLLPWTSGSFATVTWLAWHPPSPGSMCCVAGKLCHLEPLNVPICLYWSQFYELIRVVATVSLTIIFEISCQAHYVPDVPCSKDKNGIASSPGDTWCTLFGHQPARLYDQVI